MVILRGIKHRQAIGPRSVRLPTTASSMRHTKSVLSQRSDAYYQHLLWVTCCIGFFLRCGEFLVSDGMPFNPSTHLTILEDQLRDNKAPMQTFALGNLSVPSFQLDGTPGSLGSLARKCRGQGSKVSQPARFCLIYMHSRLRHKLGG